MHAQPLVVWQFSDGKRGHERQSDGLITALRERTALAVHCLMVRRGLRNPLNALFARVPEAHELPDPDLLIGTGHACHWPLIAARRARGGRSVCLMRPSLPQRCFDLCVIPRHDRPPVHPHVWISEGPLNPMRPAAKRDGGAGLILIGGPSAHHDWAGDSLLAAIRNVVERFPELRWQLTDSRRTPAAFGAAVKSLGLPQLHYRPFASCPPQWLNEQLATTAQAWVSADSVAMLYEALTAGAAVGVLEMPVRRADRIAAIAPELIRRGWVASLTGGPAPTPPQLAEAARCADELLQRWPHMLRSPTA